MAEKTAFRMKHYEWCDRTKDVGPQAAPGEMGLLTLKFRHGGAPDSMMVQCQVVHILGNGMGLSAQFSDLSKRELDMLGTMLASGRPQIEDVIDDDAA